uniref:G-protein coupled receptors family 1 profile domain-containing protein n=1 Tax=Plectus sambesii TaxID=2011161 RepID=A0A914VH60_9BILA
MLLTPVECMTHIHIWMFAFTDPAQSLMLLMVSLDRLFSVIAPLRYVRFGHRYAYALVGFVFVYSFVSAVAAWIYPLAYSGPAFIGALCVNRLAYGPFQTYLNVIRIAYAYTSVVLYAVVLIIFRKKTAKVVAPMNDARRKQ